MRKLAEYTLLITLLLYIGLFFCKKINLATVDLGRHIKNGEIILQTKKFIYTNLYSYTQPDHEFVNHHWGAGVLFYIIWQQFGFEGLTILYAVLTSLTVYFFIKVSAKRAPSPPVLLMTALLTPLISHRTEIRPEGFSALFCGIYFYLLNRFENREIKFYTLLPILLVFQVIWVNIHLFFILGIFLVGSFLINDIIFHKVNYKTYLLLLATVVAANLINPYGIKGLLEPLNIFGEYGYMVAENQGVIFMQKMFPQFLYFHFEMVFICVGSAGLYLLAEKKLGNYFILFLLPIVFGLISWKMNRMISFFALFSIPFLGVFITEILNNKLDKIFIGAFLGLMFFSVVFTHQYFSPFEKSFGIGLEKGMENSLKFFKENGLKGPIFNNYDIGSYLIYGLYPKERVFVDNRPEAYSIDLFTKSYIPMQENEEIWKEKTNLYGINVIYFYRLDYTPWAQPFLIQRLKDKDWAPVYVDDYTLILLRRNGLNRELIEKYELPKEMFVITS